MKYNNKSIFLDIADSDTAGSVQIHTDWMENTLTSKHMQAHTSRNYVLTSAMHTRKRVFLFFVLACFVFLCFRVGYLQVVKGVAYRDAAEGNRQRIIHIPSGRGLIFDAQGIQLTKNIPSFSLALVPQDLPRESQERNNLISALADLVDSTIDEVGATIEEYGSYSYESIIIEEDLDYETALRIHIASANMPGIHIHRGSKRLYVEDNSVVEALLPSSMSHILGYLGKLSPDELQDLYQKGYYPADTLGKTGIEKQYEQLLRGTYGIQRIEVDALGKEQKLLAEDPPTDGNHVYLTIHVDMQRKLEDILLNSFEENGYTRASAIVMNPNDGSILAMVSLPTFNNNDFSGGIDYTTYQSYISNNERPLFNRSIAGTYPSGSTIKPAVAAAALEEEIIEPSTSFLSSGGIQVGPWFFPDWQSGGHGNTDVRKSIAWSVNTFYYLIGGGLDEFVGLGVDRIAKYLTYFGFASQLGIDIPGEASGFIPSKQWKELVKGERWYVGDTYNLSIGQGDFLVTPLQLSTYISSIANGGTLYKPHLVQKTVSAGSGETHVVSSEVLQRIPVQKSHIETVRLGMKDCVEYGSCRRLSLLPFSSGAKTGTAQWSSVKEPHAWFTAFAPYTNPELSITVLIEEGVGGSESAAPVAYEFLKWWGVYTDNPLDE